MKIQLAISCTFLCFCFSSCSSLFNKADDLNPQNIVTPNIESDDVVLFIVDDTLVANNLAYATIKVTVSKKLRAKYASATFNITPIGTLANDNDTQTIDLDTNGVATTFAKSATAGIASIRMALGATVIKTGTIVFKSAALTDSLQLTLLQNNVSADNSSYAMIDAHVLMNSIKTGGRIDLVTDKGTFSNGQTSMTISPVSSNTTQIYLRHNRAEIAHVTATLNNTFSKQIEITFVTAYPHTMAIDPSVVTTTATFNNEVLLSTRLMRIRGTPSAGQHVLYSDLTSAGTSIGAFTNLQPSDATGTATAKYRLQDTNYHGYVYLKASVNVDTGQVSVVQKILVQ